MLELCNVIIRRSFIKGTEFYALLLQIFENLFFHFTFFLFLKLYIAQFTSLNHNLLHFLKITMPSKYGISKMWHLLLYICNITSEKKSNVVLLLNKILKLHVSNGQISPQQKFWHNLACIFAKIFMKLKKEKKSMRFYATMSYMIFNGMLLLNNTVLYLLQSGDLPHITFK